MSIYSATITLILVMDPLGNIPVFLAVLKNIPVEQRKRIILRETFFAFLILTAFLFFGQHLLAGLGLSDPALSISGGIILFLIAIKMIFPSDHEDQKTAKKVTEPFIVPLAMPLIAGPSTIAMVILMATKEPQFILNWFLALFLAWLVCAFTLVFSDNLSRLLGDRALTALERLMGMILTTMAVQMFLTGVQHFYHLG